MAEEQDPFIRGIDARRNREVLFTRTVGGGRGPSEALLELENLSGLVHHHKQQGCDKDCEISITFAKKTAYRLAQWVAIDEIDQAREILERWPY